MVSLSSLIRQVSSQINNVETLCRWRDYIANSPWSIDARTMATHNSIDLAEHELGIEMVNQFCGRDLVAQINP
ncbi:unnamed protein product [Linum trigynum]|uniref:Uncharacterized protein n=1 Tax=Linum trigynum TaxID=586398 RepID=A0AAV2FUA2_9ROSI